MTVQDLYDQIEKLIDIEFKKLDRATKRNYLLRREEIISATAELWGKAAVVPNLNPDVGNMVYVSKTEAVKYGRIEKLDETVKGVSKAGALTDISNIEKSGKEVYEIQYNGYAWVYKEGYGLPVTGGAKVKLIAETLWSDFYGNPFPELVRKNWNDFYVEIMSSVNRGLNQGASYARMARTIQGVTDTTFSKALRIGATEAHRIQGKAYLDNLGLLDELKVPYGKMWVSSIDDKTRASHIEADGDFADSKGIFHLAGGSGPAPGNIGVAAEDINCRCRAVTTFDGEKPSERRVRDEGIVPYETYKERLARGGSIPMRDVKAAR